ncbi:MAG: hypothetical protein COB12_03625 [Flavobacterium sp.]|nr:MAG: hypothetical protein COB12_03625 [Flavobacterium sp.]
MKDKKHITGIILAGGKSSRMGTDKGFVIYKNKAFIQHIIEAINPLVDKIIIVSNNPDYDIFKLNRINDLIENAGPLAGVYTGLHLTTTENNLVISCDVPLINSETLTLLIDEIDEEFDIVQLESQGKTMPLIAAYKKQCATTFYTLLTKGERRLRVALNQLKVKTILLDKEQEKFTKNINTPNNLKEIEL